MCVCVRVLEFLSLRGLERLICRRYLPKAIAMVELLNGWREMGKRDNPMPSLFHGLIWGPAEHDTCETPAYFFSVNTWSWRGMFEVGSYLVQSKLNATLGAHMLELAADFKIDIMRAAAGSAVMDSENTSKVHFLPPVAGRNQTVYKSMTGDGPYGGSSYSNFRYWSETLSSGCLGAEYDQALMNFRVTHGGTLLGMTRFRGWLDDMPTVGYAKSDIQYDRIPVFLQLLAGHVGGYQSPGTFWSTEQMALVGEGRWRGLLGGIVDIDYCVPSSMLPAFMAKWQMVYEDTDAGVVYLGKAAPRRWWQAGSEEFGVRNAPTVYGRLGWMAAPPSNGAGDGAPATVVVSLGGVLDAVTLAVRVRSPSANQTFGKVELSSGSATIKSIVSERELIFLDVTPMSASMAMRPSTPNDVTLTVHFVRQYIDAI